MSELRDIIEASENIVFFGGAGVSTESNIPDFRSESGLYNATQKYGKSPELIISHSSFIADPELFYDYYTNNMVFPDAKPNPAHYALAKLEEQGKLKAIVTQNVDGLHGLAGSKNVYELHGSVHRNYCMDCVSFFDLAYILDPKNCVDKKGKTTHVPNCDKCGGMIKPDVVLYEEPLDDETVSGAVKAISEADTLIVGGTSLVVYPAAGFLRYFKGNKLILINMSETSADGSADLVIRDPIGKVLSEFV
jgi:NAD-dependent deacetylase